MDGKFQSCFTKTNVHPSRCNYASRLYLQLGYR